MGARLAYCRVSAGGQTEASQVEQHEAAGYERLFVDRGVHGDVAPRDRPAMAELLLAYGRPGDVLQAVDMSRLGRSSVRALVFMDWLVNEKGVHVRTLREGIDTTSATASCWLVCSPRYRLGSFR